MTNTPLDAQKQKRARARQWGCLRLLVIPLIIAVACYGGMWLFARYGGEWAMSNWFPITPDAEEIARYDDLFNTRETAFYRQELYEYKGTAQGLAAWYGAYGFKVADWSDQYQIYYDIYDNVIPEVPDTPLVFLYRISVYLTSNRLSPIYCTTGSVFKTHPKVEGFKAFVPDLDLTGRNVILSLSVCWPRVT